VYWPGVFAPVLGVGEGGGRQLPPPTTRVRGYYHRENLDIVHINHAFSCICKILGGGIRYVVRQSAKEVKVSS